MKEYTIGFPIGYFNGWMGGSVLASNFTNAALQASKNCTLNVKNILLYDVSGSDISIPECGYLVVGRNQINGGAILREFIISSLYDDLYLYKNLRIACLSLNVDVLGPSYHDLGNDFPIPWSAYIPDFQHRHYPRFFSEADISSRNQMFSAILRNSNVVFVNSLSVINDINKFYSLSEINQSIKKLPEARHFFEESEDVEDLLDEFKISRNYFIVCSQQWMHKKHDTVILAFSDFLSRFNVECDLVITGELIDYRNPKLNAEIQELINKHKINHRVRYLGLIERNKQLCLISNAKSLIQASLIEGGPGASGVLEAASMDTKIIASDIPANLEMSFGRHTFFRSENIESLSKAMQIAYFSEVKNKNPILKIEADAVNMSLGLQLNRILISQT